MRMVIKKSPSGGLAGAIRYAGGVCLLQARPKPGRAKNGAFGNYLFYIIGKSTPMMITVKP